MSDRGTNTELRVRRNPHRVVQLELAFFACLALTIWATKELLS